MTEAFFWGGPWHGRVRDLDPYMHDVKVDQQNRDPEFFSGGILDIVGVSVRYIEEMFRVPFMLLGKGTWCYRSYRDYRMFVLEGGDRADPDRVVAFIKHRNIRGVGQYDRF